MIIERIIGDALFESMQSIIPSQKRKSSKTNTAKGICMQPQANGLIGMEYPSSSISFSNYTLQQY